MNLDFSALISTATFFLWRMPSSGVWRRADVVDWTDVSEDRIVSIFRVQKSASEEPAWAGSCSYGRENLKSNLLSTL
jgi:hypothetical protein